MNSVAALRSPRPDAFPEALIRSELGKWAQQLSAKKADDPFAKKKPTGTLRDVVPVVDSLTVAETFTVLEKILKYKLPAKFIKKGGYDSIEQMTEHLLPQIRNLHETGKPD